jgi:hypothetical protein
MGTGITCGWRQTALGRDCMPRRGPGESYGDVILRLAKATGREATPAEQSPGARLVETVGMGLATGTTGRRGESRRRAFGILPRKVRSPRV